MIEPTWLRTIAPTATPIAPQNAGADDRAETAAARRRCRAVGRDVSRREAEVADAVREDDRDGAEDEPDDEARGELRAEDATPARRDEERRPDRAEAVLARQEQHARERREQRRRWLRPEQLSLILGRPQIVGAAAARSRIEIATTSSEQADARARASCFVERIFRISARIWAITRPPLRLGRCGQLEEDLLERGAGQHELVQHDAGRGRDLADPLDRRRRHDQRAVLVAAPCAPACSSAACSFGGLGAAHAHRAADAARQLGERRLDDQLAAGDDQHVVDRLRDLGEHVARHQHRAAAGRVRADEVAQPAHALGVETVRRLVQDQQLGVAEQRRGETEPLAHAERVALHAPVGGALELDELQHLAHARVGHAT